MIGSPAARLTGSPGPAMERVHHASSWVPCDATASKAEFAQVHLARGQATLSLCGHHFGRYELVLLGAGWRITSDTRSQLA